MRHVTQEEVQVHVGKWQDILRLRDWDIIIQIVETPWKKSGDIKYNRDVKTAVLLINQTPIYTHIEGLVIHELLHLKLSGLDEMIEELLDIVFGNDATDAKREFARTRYMTLTEATVEDLTKGYLAAIGSEAPLSLGRLQAVVDEETGEQPKVMSTSGV